MLSLGSRIVQGDSVHWDVALPDYPASAWELTLYFAQAAEAPQQVTATPNGDAYIFDFTCEMVPGTYLWSARVKQDTTVKTLGCGRISVLPDPSLPFDRRLHCEKALEAITAALEGRLSDPIATYKLDGVEATKIPHADLLRLRDRYRTEVRLARGGSVIRTYGVNW